MVPFSPRQQYLLRRPVGPSLRAVLCEVVPVASNVRCRAFLVFKSRNSKAGDPQ